MSVRQSIRLGVYVLAAAVLVCSCEEEKKPPKAKVAEKKAPPKPKAKAAPKAEARPALPAPLDTMIPRPNQVTPLKKHVAISRARIVTVGSHEKFDIAAAEISGRIASLGAVALDRLTASGRTIPGEGVAIVLLSADMLAARKMIRAYRLPISPEKPGKEGYVIRFVKEGGRNLIFLAGSDPQGTLYAAVTLRHMIVKMGGEFVVCAADITDWPDFKIRQIGTPWAVTRRYPYYELKAAAQKGEMEKAKEYEKQLLAVQHEYIDWMLRHKINFMLQPCRFWRHTPEAETPFMRQVCRKINDYAKARGIGAMVMASSCIWTDKEGENADLKECVYHSSHHRFFCWSRLDYHRKKAKAFAEYLRDCNFSAFYLHATDGGGWQNPAMWKNRCPQCRKIYGDDHAKADSVVFGIYYKELRRLNPDIRIVAVVYPYSPAYLDPAWIEEQIKKESGEVPGAEKMAKEIAARHGAFLRRINQLFPRDIYVCVRENTRQNIDRMREVYGRRNFHLYYEYAYWKGWRPNFIMTPRWTKTFLYDGYEDILFGNNSGYGLNPLTQMYGAECCWNVDGPGRWFFPSKEAWMDPWNCLVPRGVAKEFAEKACRNFWGDVAGPYFVPVFMGNTSFYFIHDPESIASKCHLVNLPELMEKQHEAAAEAVESLEKLRTKMAAAAGKSKAWMTPQARRYLTEFYKLMMGARVVAGFKYRIMLAREAVIAGDMAKADVYVAELRKQLKADERDLTAMRAALKGAPRCVNYWRKTSTQGSLVHVDVKELSKQLDTFDAERQKLFTAYNIPKWFKSQVQNRTLYALRTKEPIKVDGKLTEKAWQQASPVEHFVYYKSLRLGCRETVCRMLYDDKYLYVGFECFDPKAKSIKIAKRDRDRHELCESVEVFLDPKRDRKTFVQYIVDAAGNLFDAARRADDRGALAYTKEFNGKPEFATRVDKDRWVAEIAIPFSELGATPKAGTRWGANVCRNICNGRENGKEEPVAAGYLGGKGFRTPEAFPTLQFVDKVPPAQEPDVTFRVTNAGMVYETTGRGAGTRLHFDLLVETGATLRDAALSAEMWAGDKRLGRVELFKEPKIQLIWRSRKPFVINLNEMPKGVEMVFRLKSGKREWTGRYVFGRPPRRKPKPAKFVPGVDGKALASPVFFPAAHKTQKHILSKTGTIEFWLKPEWSGSETTGGRRYMSHVLIDVGPVRYDHPHLMNCRSIGVYDTGHGRLCFIITSRRYNRRSVDADISGWKRGTWHHVAAQWAVGEKGQCDMSIYLDGKKASGKMQTGRFPEFKKHDEMFPVQVGAMNTGVCPMAAAMDELRISTTTRYAADFTPPKRLSPDKETGALFRFDGNLEGTCGADGQSIQAEAGTAG